MNPKDVREVQAQPDFAVESNRSAEGVVPTGVLRKCGLFPERPKGLQSRLRWPVPAQALSPALRAP